MPLEMILALIGFAFVMSISPGPANFLLLASGANFGVLRSLPLIFGVSLGFLSMVFAVGLGLGQLLKEAPMVETGLRVACGAYILWLAYKIAGARSMGDNAGNEGEKLAKPVSFIQAALLQLLNPKAWTVALLVTVTYMTEQDYLANLIVLVAVFAVVNIPSISIWAISGAALRKRLSQGSRLIWFNRIMALLLVASMAPMLIHL
ncbi:Threonine/homoserine/homoserine lactone efflux protein [Cohaesibacter marisflavi]|uniref:Threonine/homoserine/homoserine lactone efflux protein n=1 Tax=Cohaesibacter marisflavi TaxID=655353 RepID=A0A1I5GWK8_9HYPH|nr:LysE family translocator [Cohaesibacter marisflavi]SFO40206.1 Threonine/homoserine/homoserine lactone efflux protein [Cohaesibacter marisflavi]